MIESESFEQVMIHFHNSVDLKGEEREQYLSSIVPSEIRAKVSKLLAQDEATSAVLPKNMESQSVDDALGRMVVEVAERSMPSTVGQYKILEDIGMGGMGIVYRAEHKVLGRVVALKILRATLITQPSLRRFQYEITVLSKLKHRYIATLYEAGLHEHLGQNLPYFAMEFIEGEDLLTYSKALDVSSKVELLSRVAAGVHHAHQKGVIHRDLKPSNILIDSSGVPKILDFGIARTLNSDLRVTKTQGEDGSRSGTLAYMSPEQLENETVDLDIRSDIYALGVVGFEMMTGALPYKAGMKTLAGAVRAICHEPASRARSIDPTLDRDLDAILSKCLEKNPSLRYQSASELGADLGRFSNGAPVMARPPSRLYVIGKFMRRRKAFTAAVLIVVLALLAAGWQWQKASNQARANLEKDVQRLRALDFVLASGLAKEAETLWPLKLADSGELLKWVDDAEGLLIRLEDYGLSARSLALERGVRSSGSTWSFQDPEDQLRYDEFKSLAKTGALLGDSSTGVLGRAYLRLRELEDLEKTMIECDEDWEDVLLDIESNSAWEDTSLEVQNGLVPLGKNDKGFWEFWYVMSGERPIKDNGEKLSRWAITEDMGMVFILLPPERVVVGAQRRNANDLNYDRNATDFEPIHEVEVGAVFVSKYEMTQGQWLRVMDSNPSHCLAGASDFDGTYPVENVSYDDCLIALGRWGMDLPTGAEWEYAARGGKDTPWWTGPTKPSDDSNIGNMKAESGSALGALPIGSYMQNPFGFHDTIGNVFELTSQNFHGEGPQKLVELYKTARGGGYNFKMSESRVSHRSIVRSTSRASDTGVRPVIRWNLQ